MKWQRARMLTSRMVGGPPVGFECWVLMGPPVRPDPEYLVVASGTGELVVGDAPRYRSNILNRPDVVAGDAVTEETWVRATAVELLGRGPEDFCDDPLRIPWGAWATDGARD